MKNNIAQSILDKKWVKDFLENKSQEIFGKDANIEVTDIQRSYTFNTESYNLLYSLEVNGQGIDMRVAYSTQADKVTNYKILQYLSDSGFGKDRFLVPKTYAFIKEFNLLLYENIPGRTFMHELTENVTDLKDKVSQAAQALKKFHQLPLPPIKLWPQDWNLNKMAMTKNYPDLGAKIVEIYKYIFSRLGNSQSRDFCHGDYQPNNLIFYNDNLYLIDFGSVCALDRELDVASFVLQLKIMLKRFGDIANFRLLEEKFLAEYGEYNHEKFDLYLVLLSLRVLDFFIVFPDAENNRERTPFGYELVKENLDKIGISLKNAQT